MWDPKENAQGFTKEEQELWMNAPEWNDKQKIVRMRDERRQREREEQLRQQWDNSEEGRTFKKLAESFAACRKLLRQNPNAEQQAAQLGEKNYDVYARLKENLERANQAPRCCFVKTSGELCRAPKIKGQQYCCMHLAMMAARDKEKEFELPPLDDPNAVQVAITRGARGVLDGSLDEKRAMKLAYFLQLAVTNVNRVNFEPEYEDN
jgi:hypothetical protein